jgi:hypothetical protein
MLRVIDHYLAHPILARLQVESGTCSSMSLWSPSLSNAESPTTNRGLAFLAQLFAHALYQGRGIGTEVRPSLAGFGSTRLPFPQDLIALFRDSKPMSAKRNFDVELAAVESLRDLSSDAAAPQLAKALEHRNNLIVSKAAAVTLHHQLTSLTPKLVAAFGRFLENPAKSDPQCWAKNALAKTLAAFEYQEPELFLAGLRHIQLEPVWGGSADSASTLRSTCALAIVQCRELDSHRLLIHLVPLLADKELRVRINVVRAIEQTGTDSCALLLRLLAEIAVDAELLGACYAGVLALEGPSAIAWAARFLPGEDERAAEAAMAIAQTHTPDAFQWLRTTFGGSRDLWFRTTLLSAIALTRQQEATDWLLDLIASDDAEANSAHEALCRSAPSADTQDRLKELGRPCV